MTAPRASAGGGGERHPVETATAEEMRRQQQASLAAQIPYLIEHSRFYGAKLAAAGFARNRTWSLEDLPAIPFTLKDEIRVSLEARRPLGDHLAAAPEDLVQFHSSSGTSGRPSHVGLTREDLADWTEIIRRSLVTVGLRPRDRVLHANGLSRGWVGGQPVVQGLEALGAGVIPIGSEPGTTFLLNVIRDLEPVALIATPNFAIYLAEQAEAVLGLPAHELPIRRIWTGGEPGGGVPSIRDRAERLWNAEMREVMGGTDVSPVVWAECEQGTGMHLVAPDSVYVELISTEDQSPLSIETGAVGELVYSHLRRRACPILRFRHGDVVEVTGMGCSCGRTGPKIRCFGRTDDMFIVKGVNVYPSAIQDIAMSLRPATSGAVRIVKESEDYAIPGPLRVRVERGADLPESEGPALAARVADLISDLCRCRATVELVAPGTYPPPGRAKMALVERPSG